MDKRLEEIDSVVARLRDRFGDPPPRVGVVLGSGLGSVTNALLGTERAKYEDIGLPSPGVFGHAGELAVGYAGDTRVACLSGRQHMYEGHDPARCVVGVRALLRWGIETLIVTASSGSLRPEVGPGSVVMITDHMNLTGRNPLLGPNVDALGPRFPDCTFLYDRELRARAKELAVEEGITLYEGIYAAMLGPSYETPAEVRMLKLLGADLVGMSLIPEALAGRHGGARIAGFSVVANLAAGLTDTELEHEGLTDALETSAHALAGLIVRLVEHRA